MERFGSLRVLDQRVIALPVVVRLLTKLHFDFYAFVYNLNHVPTYTPRKAWSLDQSELWTLIA